MEKKIKQMIYILYNFFRIIASALLIVIFIGELYNISMDPITYEKVYTGEFLGKFRFEDLKNLKAIRYSELFLSIVYITFEISHLTILKKSIFLTWILRIVDVLIISFLLYNLYYFYFEYLELRLCL